MWNLLRNKMPPKEEMLPVLGTIMFLVYGWSFINLMWKIPSWLGILTVEEILGITAYVLTISLLESTFAFVVIVLLALVLPQAIFREKFSIRASAIVFFFSLWSGFLIYIFSWNLLPTPKDLLSIGVVVIFTVVLVLFILNRVTFFDRFLELVSDKLSAFVFIYIPLGLLGLFTVLLRIIF